MQRVGELERGVVEGVAGGGLHEGRDAGVVEPDQLHAADAAVPMELGERLDERV